ncbi:MAG: magnesium and cobalt transport protein CorA [Cytophagales bacterium]|nr:MAG: magnesium and cobalt transport protein CorA [Cytophagales bacterium]
MVFTFQSDIVGDAFDEVRLKLKISQNKVRKSNTDFLMYELLEATIESYFKIIEEFGEKIEELETSVMSKPDTTILRKIYKLRRSMMFLRKTIWPMREILNNLIRSDNEIIHSSINIYLRDVYEHCTQLLDHIEINREMLAGLLDIYLSSISYRMNAVMKVLTIISTIFIPLTFITSIYGMNFEVMPELKWRFGYTLVWVLVVSVTVLMLIYFKKKKWF